MPLSLLDVTIGFTLGVVGSAIAWALTTREVRNPERTRFTAVWSLADVIAPGESGRLIVERLDGVRVPDRTRMIVPEGAQGAVPADLLARCEVRMHPEVATNFCLGRDRALVFATFPRPRAHAVWTLEPDVVSKLGSEFARMWAEATPYVEPMRLADAHQYEGRIVEAQGFASDLVEYRGQRMLRVMEGGASVGVLTADPEAPRLQGGPVRIVGRVVREGNTVFIDAREITRAQTGPIVAR